MGCSEDTIERQIRDKYECTFSEYREQRLSVTKKWLIERVLQRAKSDDAMLKYAVDNLCGWGQKLHQTVEQNVSRTVRLELSYSKDKLKEAAEKYERSANSDDV
jgi:hypothetical protein